MKPNSILSYQSFLKLNESAGSTEERFCREVFKEVVNQMVDNKSRINFKRLETGIDMSDMMYDARLNDGHVEYDDVELIAFMDSEQPQMEEGLVELFRDNDFTLNGYSDMLASVDGDEDMLGMLGIKRHEIEISIFHFEVNSSFSNYAINHGYDSELDEAYWDIEKEFIINITTKGHDSCEAKVSSDDPELGKYVERMLDKMLHETPETIEDRF